MEIRIAVQNATDTNGLFFTPVWFGLHDDSFDLFDVGASANVALERIAEDGDFAEVNALLDATQPDAQGGLVAGAAGPIADGELADAIVELDPEAQTQLTLAAMILPSNDAFIGTDEAIELFTENGRFAGEQNIAIFGDDVYDAGTEVNTELDAAFLNQTAPNTGVDEGGVIRQHPGFNGSEGNPVGEGAQNILGGVNAFGAPIDADAADFTQEGFQVATFHVNTVVRTEGSFARDVIFGGRSDDIVEAGGGNDWVGGGRGWDILSGGDGNDDLFGGRGADQLFGEDGRDFLSGGRDADLLDGGAGRDHLRGGLGDDILLGGDDNDTLRGGRGRDVLDGQGGDDLLVGGRDADVFRLVGEWGDDRIRDFNVHEDTLVFSGGPASLDDLEVSFLGKGRAASTLIEFGDQTLLLDRVDEDEFAKIEIEFFDPLVA